MAMALMVVISQVVVIGTPPLAKRLTIGFLRKKPKGLQFLKAPTIISVGTKIKP
jgi:hypothetical protein